ncbi:hypothetical protein [Pseudomonas sp. SBT1-2]|uniref:hypothetical protein n=1 Tax=Pseudomonas sp. SBT1-2 TaxID=3027852 RepID=UPI00235DCE40|nr:hypothetical protein [Pseudomonas sp. SBT1-2]
MSGTDEDFDAEAWLANRPSLTEMKSHPNHWFNRSSDLHASAGAVWHSMGDNSPLIAKELGLGPNFDMGVACYHVYHMLCGLALEVIMKAVLIQRGVDPKDFKTHSFEKLNCLLRVSVDEQERNLLKFYEGMLVWAARYPTPTDVTDEKLKSFYSLSDAVLTKDGPPLEGTTFHFTVSSGATDWDVFSALWAKYANLFDHN